MARIIKLEKVLYKAEHTIEEQSLQMKELKDVLSRGQPEKVEGKSKLFDEIKEARIETLEKKLKLTKT